MSKVIYQLKMFSSSLKYEPKFIVDGMKNILTIEGYDETDVLRKIEITFDSVLAYKKTSAGFTPELYGSYDKVVELTESVWLHDFEKINKKYYDYWKPRHFILYLDSIGMYEFIASEIKVNEYK